MNRLTNALAALAAPFVLPFAALIAIAARLQALDVSSFIPEFWIRELLRKLRHSLVYAQPRVANRNYEGVIRQAGDTVKINSVGEVTVKDYDRNVGIDSPERLSTTLRSLAITEEKYFNFAVDDVDSAQAAGSVLDGGMESAAFQMRDVADIFVASHYVDVDGDNLIGDDTAPVELTDPSHAYFYLNRLGLVLDNAKVTREGRWAVVPPWYAALLTLDKRFTSAGDSGSSEALRNGVVGRAAGFDVLTSHNTPVGDPAGANENDKVIAGVPMAHSYAEQINKTEAYRPQQDFADAVKGLHVYGAKLVYTEGWAVLSAVDGVGNTPPA